MIGEPIDFKSRTRRDKPTKSEEKSELCRGDRVALALVYYKDIARDRDVAEDLMATLKDSLRAGVPEPLVPITPSLKKKVRSFDYCILMNTMFQAEDGGN